MKNKRLSEYERKVLKKQLEIDVSDNANNSCINCFHYASNRVCSKHFIVTKADEHCKSYFSKRIEVFSGGSAPSK